MRLLAALLVVLATACQTLSPAGVPPGATPTLRVVLNAPAGAQHAGLFYAERLGYYAERSLHVGVAESTGSAAAVQRLADGAADVAVADALETIRARAAGAPVTIVGAMLQTSSLALMSRGDRITQVGLLSGKTVGIPPGPLSQALLTTVLAQNGVASGSVTVSPVAAITLGPRLRNGQADTILAPVEFQGLQLAGQGYDTTKLMLRDVGAPVAGVVLVARDDLLQRESDRVGAFVGATLRGWDAARQDPLSASEAIVEQRVAGTTEDMLPQLRALLPFLCAPGGTRLGVPPADVWSSTRDVLLTAGLVGDLTLVDGAHTDDQVPADAPPCMR